MSKVYQGNFTGKQLDDILATIPQVLEKTPILEEQVGLLTPQEITEEEADDMIENGTWVEGQIYFVAEED